MFNSKVNVASAYSYSTAPLMRSASAHNGIRLSRAEELDPASNPRPRRSRSLPAPVGLLDQLQTTETSTKYNQSCWLDVTARSDRSTSVLYMD